MDSVVLVIEKDNWLPAFLDAVLERGTRVLQERRVQSWQGWARRTPSFHGIEAVVVDTDIRYRDRVLLPSLLAVGFARVHTAKNADQTRKLIERNPRIGVVVVADDLQTSDEERAVAHMAGANLIPLVLLTEGAEPADWISGPADRVLNRKGISVLETVRQIRGVAARAWLRTASTGHSSVVPSC
jgi:hypothetical protein